MTRPRNDLKKLDYCAELALEIIHQASELSSRSGSGELCIKKIKQLASRQRELISDYRRPLDNKFSEWIRARSGIDQEAWGMMFTDLDYTPWVTHRYLSEKFGESREFQWLMIIEEKAGGATAKSGQLETLGFVDGLIKSGMKEASDIVRKVFFSRIACKNVHIAYCGFHELVFSGYGPSDSEIILWDKNPITQEQLEKLLKFDLNPYDLKPTGLHP